MGDAPSESSQHVVLIKIDGAAELSEEESEE